MDFGCFVRIRECGDKEGLVHVSMIKAAKVNNAKDHVKRGQTVWVKVISLAGKSVGEQDLNLFLWKDDFYLHRCGCA